MNRSNRFLFIRFFFLIAFFLGSCSKLGPEKVWDNPNDPDGVNWSPHDSDIVVNHKFPVVTRVNDTIVGKNASANITVNAFDSNSETLRYFWSTESDGHTDTTDKPEHVFERPSGGLLVIRWGAIDKDGNAASDTFSILFNRPPNAIKLKEPVSGNPAEFNSYNSVTKEGSIRIGFSGEDPDGNSDTLSYSFFIGTKPDSLLSAYSGRLTTFLAEHLRCACDYYWKLQARDLFGDSIESTGSFTTAASLPSPKGMKLILSRDKSFIMGRSGFDSSEIPVHSVSFSYEFWMDSSEVTAHDFSFVMGFGSASSASTKALPAANCNWFDAVLYCNARSKLENRDTVYSYKSISGEKGNGCVLGDVSMNMAVMGYRLPSEAEWEFACRGGTQSTFFWGDSLADAGVYGWTLQNSNGRMQPIGTKKPNAFGLFDLSGNVAEWCNDWFSASYYAQSPSTDPIGPSVGSRRVLRGGSFQDDASFASCGKRSAMNPEASSVAIGFRTVLRSQ
jgi:formylglycine-generating enzyme required for sulfatase activity